MTPKDAWQLAYRFIRSDAAIPWQEEMRPFKLAAIIANKARREDGTDRWGEVSRLNGRSQRRRVDLIYAAV